VAALYVYTLCSLTSLFCTLVVGRAWYRTKVRLLLWCSLCFLLLTVNNVFLFVDLVVLPAADYTIWRSVSNLIGLIWDSN
jgi:hypothetical protein